MVDGQQCERLDELGLNGRGADDDQRLFGNTGVPSGMA